MVRRRNGAPIAAGLAAVSTSAPRLDHCYPRGLAILADPGLFPSRWQRPGDLYLKSTRTIWRSNSPARAFVIASRS